MIYSPSSREDFSFCPRMWWLRKNGYTTRSIGYPELCAIGGNAVGRAMELWNIDVMQSDVRDLSTYIGLALTDLRLSIGLQMETGRTLAGSKEGEFVNELPLLVGKAIELLWSENPLKRYAILSAEESFPQAGGSRLDVRVKQADGRQMVVDYKCKFTPTEEKYYTKAMQEYFSGEQRLTYTHLTGTDMFGIIMVCLQPLKDKTRQPLKPYIRFETSPVTKEEQEVWLRDALLMTPLMDHTLTIQAPQYVVGKTFPHSNQYGPCKYEDACIRYALNPEKMSLDYITVKKGE